MKRTILFLLVAGLFAGIGTSAMAQDAAAQPAATAQSGASPGTNSNSQQPDQSATNPAKADSSAMAPLNIDDLTAQRPAASAKQTNPAKEDGAAPAKDFAGNSSDQPKKTKDY